MSGGVCLQGVWRVSAGCLQGVRRVSENSSLWGVSGRCNYTNPANPENPENPSNLSPHKFAHIRLRIAKVIEFYELSERILVILR